MGTECPTPLELYDYNVGRLRGPGYDQVEEHLGGCGDCQRRLENEALFDEAVRQAVEGVIPADVLARMTHLGETHRRRGDGQRGDQTRRPS